ncbi:4-oxalomesaconate tautomerase [Streptomyces xiamenensis]|nr:4-oxalomesaconate tautomerase [Streptomyces xiamenensis]
MSKREPAGIPCLMMRGGTSKGAFFLAEDLPQDPAERDDLLLRIMGSPHARQIDGIGGGHPLTSKVAVVTPRGPDTVDYLFLQVAVDEGVVSDRQNCGNILAGVGPFALERGLVPATGELSTVRIGMLNTGGTARAHVRTPDGAVSYRGDAAIDGVPGTASPVVIDFEDTAGSSCGALLPTGNVRDILAGTPVTCVDNGMPVVVMAAADVGVTGTESPAELEADTRLRALLEDIRRAAGPLMNLGEVSGTTVPKLTLVSAPRAGGTIATRTFIPHRCHTSIGVLGAAGVAVAAALPGSVAAPLAAPAEGARHRVEHPTGHADVEIELAGRHVVRTSVVRTARKLFDGTVFPRPGR